MTIFTENFEKCIAVILKHEGGFQSNPNDAGNWVGGYKTGKLVGTKYGIAAKFFPDEDIINLTVDRAKYLYYTKYWLPLNLFGIYDAAKVLEIFDFSVNAGKGNGTRTAQRIVNVKVDGVIGPVSTYYINEFDDFVLSYKEARIRYYMDLVRRKPSYKIFLKGWINRVENNHF